MWLLSDLRLFKNPCLSFFNNEPINFSSISLYVLKNLTSGFILDKKEVSNDCTEPYTDACVLVMPLAFASW